MKAQGYSVGKHSRVRRHDRQAVRRGMVEMVDIRTGDNHLLTPDAAAAGRREPNRYHALCGADIVPAALVDPGTGNCWPCWSSPIPAQRAET
jgi:hypothetical protein